MRFEDIIVGADAVSPSQIKFSHLQELLLLKLTY